MNLTVSLAVCFSSRSFLKATTKKGVLYHLFSLVPLLEYLGDAVLLQELSKESICINMSIEQHHVLKESHPIS